MTSCNENKTIIKSTIPHIFPWITLFCINLERIKTKNFKKKKLFNEMHPYLDLNQGPFVL